VPAVVTPRIEILDEMNSLKPGILVEMIAPERVARLCHGAADPHGSVRTCPDEETR